MIYKYLFCGHQMDQGFIEFKICRVGLIINCFVLRVRLMASCLFHGQGNCFVVVFVEGLLRLQRGVLLLVLLLYRMPGRQLALPVISDLIWVQRRELAEPPMALNTSALAPASSAISRLCLRENATPSMQARTMWPLVLAKSSP